MEKRFKKNIPNHEASRKLAQELVAEHLAPESKFVMLIEGTLGAGKTFMVKEMLAALGVQEEVNSPTYALVNEYENQENRRFAHFDFYRLEEPQDFFARGFQDITDDPNTSCFIEWPEKLDEATRNAFTGAGFILKIEFGIGVGMRKVTLLKK